MSPPVRPSVGAVRVLVAGLVIVFGSALAVACASSSTPAAPTDDPVLVEGQKVYAANCASCHGSNGSGGYGKKLAGVVTTKYPDIADQVAVITNGKGAMPSFAQKLTPEQVQAVARYTREVL